MQTRFEHFAVGGMMGQPDTPPRSNGALCFTHSWERQAFGIALALARDGYFEWENFRSELIAEIDGWEKTHDFEDTSWDYYERWLAALERVVAHHLSNEIA